MFWEKISKFNSDKIKEAMKGIPANKSTSQQCSLITLQCLFVPQLYSVHSPTFLDYKAMPLISKAK